MSDCGTDEIWIVDRFDACWEDVAVVRNLRERGTSARYLDWNDIGFGTEGLTISKEPVAPPAVAYIRSRVLTQGASELLAETYDRLEMFEDMGTTLINSLAAIRACQNKVRQAHILKAADVPVPRTRLVSSGAEIEECLKDWGVTILKPIHGHGSIDLVRLRPPVPASAGSGLDPIEEVRAWHALQRHKILCAQEYVPNSGRDLRVAVIDHDIVGCYWRSLAVTAMDYRLDVEPAPVTDEVAGLVKRCVDELGLGIATIDLVMGERGLTVIEVNASLSVWERAEGNPGIDLSPHGITDRHGEYIQGELRVRRSGIR